MRKTGKIYTVLLTALLATLILFSSCKPAKADIGSYIWKPGSYVYKDYDSYYGADIVAYLDGATVHVTIPVSYDWYYYTYYFDYCPNINVTDVNMVFDWGLNKSCSTTLPVKIDYGETKYFEVSFTADEDDASNAWAHAYTTYVKLNYTAYGFNYTYTWTRGYDYLFVAWLEDQNDAMDLSRTYGAYAYAYPPSYFSTVQGRLLATQAKVEASQGDTLWGIGDFTAAKTHYQNAVDLYEGAFAEEEDKGVVIEDTELNATKKIADAAMLEAQAIMNQAYGYILLGLGFVLVGVGAILYGAKKPKPA